MACRTLTSDCHDEAVWSRYELKYSVKEECLADLRRAILPFVRPDPYAEFRTGFRYPVCSLYLDSAGLTLYRATIHGHKSRFKLRLRTYDPDPTAPVYAEVKKRIDDVIVKRRSRLTSRQAAQFMRRILDPQSPPATHAVAGAAEFCQATTLLGARPAVRVRYLREAYEAVTMPPLRITFDTAVASALSIDGNGSHTEGRWQSLHPHGVIVEIKFTDVFPSWIAHIVRSFELQRQPIPKYVLSINNTVGDATDVPMIPGLDSLPSLAVAASRVRT